MMSGFVASPRRANVHERDDLGAAVGNDVARKRSDGRTAGAPRVDHGGDAGPHAREVGVHTEAGHSVEHVGMQVDDPGDYQLLGHVDDLARFLQRDAGRDTGDNAVFHRDVQDAVQLMRRVDDGTAAEQQNRTWSSPSRW